MIMSFIMEDLESHFLRIHCGNIFIKIVQDFKIRLDISSGRHHGAHPAPFSFEVHEAQGNRNTGAEGNIVEARLPVIAFGTFTLRGNADDEFVILLKMFNGLCNHIVAFTAIDGNAAEPLHEHPRRPKECGVLCHEEYPALVSKCQSQHEGNIPHACVRRANQNKFVWQRVNSLGAPSADLENKKPIPRMTQVSTEYQTLSFASYMP